MFNPTDVKDIYSKLKIKVYAWDLVKSNKNIKKQFADKFGKDFPV